MNHEFKRMLELAGLTEIKVNRPPDIIKIKLPVDPVNDKTKVPIEIPIEDLEAKYDDLIKDFIKINPQIDPQFLEFENDGLFNDIVDTLDTKYPDGATVSEFYRTYFYWLWANLVSDYSKYEDDEIEERETKYGHMRDEFADNAMKGRWLVVSGVTS